MRDAERRGRLAGKARGLGKGWGRSRPVTRGPESRQGRRGEEKVGDAATVHGGAGPAERPDRQTDEDGMEQAGETDGGHGGWHCPSTQVPASLVPAALAPYIPPRLSPPAGTPLPAGPPGSRSLSRPCALSFPPSQSSRQPPLPLRPIMNQGLPASLLAPHSLTHSHSLAPAARPPRTVSAAVSPSLASRQTSQGPSLRLWVSLCLSLWLPQVSPTANLLAPPRPSRLTPGLLHPAPTLPGALICRPRAGQHRAGGCPDDRLGGAGPAPARPALRLTTPQSGPPAPA